MNNNLEFENEDPSPDSIEDNHPRTNYGEGYGGKETLEEAAENNSKKGKYFEGIGGRYLGFIDGAEWQQERMYSEEEVQIILSKLLFDLKHNGISNSVEWFEQFKNK